MNTRGMNPAFLFNRAGSESNRRAFLEKMLNKIELTMNSKPEQERLLRLIKALKEEVERFECARTSPKPADSFTTLGNALNWITVLDTDFAKIHGSPYRNRRDEDELGRAVLGHRFARNLLNHNNETTDLVDVVGGAYFPVRPPVCPFELKWKVFADLPKQRKPDKLLMESYVKYLAGRLARDTLRDALAFFTTMMTTNRGS